MLDSVHRKLMLYLTADKLAYIGARMAIASGNSDVEFDFENGCVINYPGHGRLSETMIVCVEKTADRTTVAARKSAHDYRWPAP